MQLAQALYEGIDLGAEGTVGLITYMRTDSTRIADTARDAVVSYVDATYGKDFVGPFRQHKLREGAQDAHEAIRPTSVERTPERMSQFLKRDELRLYTLDLGALRRIANGGSGLRSDDRRLRSQGPLDFARDRLPRHVFRATGSVLKFAGFTAVYDESTEEAAASDAAAAAPVKSKNGKVAKPRVMLPATRGGTVRSIFARSIPSSISPSRRRASPKRRWYARSKKTGSGGRRRTARSSRRFRRAATSNSSSAASIRPRSVLRSTICSSSISPTSST